MFNRICSIVLILGISMSSYGCATMMWNKRMDASMETTFGYVPTDYQGRLLKGYFQGIKEDNGDKYYHFVIPDVFRNSDVNGIEVVVPLAPTDKKAKITMLDTYERIGNPVYVKYTTSIGYEEKEAKQISSLSKYAPPPDAIQETITFAYPALMAFSLPYYSSGAYIRIGQPVNNIPSSMNPDLNNKSNLMCRKMGSHYVNAPSGKTVENAESESCDWWYWSDTYMTNRYDSRKYIATNSKKYLGYIITVPVDIITSPIQLLFYVIMPKPRWGP